MRQSYELAFAVFWPMAGAPLSYLIGRRNKKARNLFSNAVTASVLAVMLFMFVRFSSTGELRFSWDGICGFGLHLMLDGFRLIYGTVAALMWTMTSLFSAEYFAHYRNRNRYYLFYLLTFSATLGVFMSADLYTAFIFFEIMSMTSYVMVVHDERPAAMRAGDTYLAVAVIGGLVMLMGLFLLDSLAGTLVISELYDACHHIEDKAPLYVAGALILFGYGAKAGMFPVHIWLPKAHPVAPAPASALLSGILTKAGVFGVLVVSANIFLHDANWGLAMLFIGVITMFLGAFLAVFSVDLKRTLACSSMSQIGFILTGTAMQGLLGHHNALAVRGTLLHMVNHSLIKLALFMAAGVVYMKLHKLDLNDIRGFGRGKPVLTFSFLMGYLGIIGMPLWNGYVSKTLIHESIVEYIHAFTEYAPMLRLAQTAEYIFVFTGGLTAAYMTKLFVAIFIEKNPYGQEKLDSYNGRYLSKAGCFALAGSAAILPVLGFAPGTLMDGIATLGQGFMHGEPPAHEVHYFAWVNLRGGLMSLAIGAIVYFLVIRVSLMKTDENGNRIYADLWPRLVDLENLIYRPALSGLTWAFAAVFRGLDILPGLFVRGFMWLSAAALRALGSLPDLIVRGFVWLSAAVLRALGSLPDLIVRAFVWVSAFLSRVFSRAVDYDVTLDRRRQAVPDVLRSLSFSLMLFGIGFCIVLVYLLASYVTW